MAEGVNGNADGAPFLIVLAGDAGLTALKEVISLVSLPMFIRVFVLYRGLSQEDLSEEHPV